MKKVFSARPFGRNFEFGYHEAGRWHQLVTGLTEQSAAAMLEDFRAAGYAVEEMTEVTR